MVVGGLIIGVAGIQSQNVGVMVLIGVLAAGLIMAGAYFMGDNE